MKKRLIIFAVPLIIALVTMLVGVGGGLVGGRYWFSQPQIAYPALFKSVGTAQCIVDSKCTRYTSPQPVHWFLGLGIITTHRLLALSGTITDIMITAALLRPELFLVIMHVMLLGTISLAQIIGGYLIYRKSKSISLLLLFQLSPIYTPKLLENLTKINPELVTISLHLLLISIFIYFIFSQEKWPRWFIRLKLITKQTNQVDISYITFFKLTLVLSGLLLGLKIFQSASNNINNISPLYLLPLTLILFITTLQQLWPKIKLTKIIRLLAAIAIIFGTSVSLILSTHSAWKQNQKWQLFLVKASSEKLNIIPRDEGQVKNLSLEKYTLPLQALLIGNININYQLSDVLVVLYGE